MQSNISSIQKSFKKFIADENKQEEEQKTQREFYSQYIVGNNRNVIIGFHDMGEDVQQLIPLINAIKGDSHVLLCSFPCHGTGNPEDLADINIDPSDQCSIFAKASRFYSAAAVNNQLAEIHITGVGAGALLAMYLSATQQRTPTNIKLINPYVVGYRTNDLLITMLSLLECFNWLCCGCPSFTIKYGFGHDVNFRKRTFEYQSRSNEYLTVPLDVLIKETTMIAYVFSLVEVPQNVAGYFSSYNALENSSTATIKVQVILNSHGLYVDGPRAQNKIAAFYRRLQNNNGVTVETDFTYIDLPKKHAIIPELMQNKLHIQMLRQI